MLRQLQQAADIDAGEGPRALAVGGLAIEFDADRPAIRDRPHQTHAIGGEIAVADLPESIREESTASTDFVIPPHRTLAEIEKMAILQTLQRTNWNKQEAAQILGLYRPTLYSKMKKHDIRDAGKAARTPPSSSPTPASP